MRIAWSAMISSPDGSAISSLLMQARVCADRMEYASTRRPLPPDATRVI